MTKYQRYFKKNAYLPENKEKRIALDLVKYDANKNKCIKEKSKTYTNDM